MQARLYATEATGSSQATPHSTSAAPGGTPPDSALTSNLRFRPSRFLRLHQEVLQREMQLRQGRPATWRHTPKLHAIDLVISARADTRLGHDDVNKADMLLYRLALDHLTGGAAPARFVEALGRKGGMLTSGVRARLQGSASLDFLERLVHMVLPNQISFEGLGPARRLVRKGGSVRPHWNPANAPPEDLWSVQLRVDNLLLFPDFERNFELFEPLRSMQVDMQVAEAGSAEMARLYLAGFGLPLKTAVP